MKHLTMVMFSENHQVQELLSFYLDSLYQMKIQVFDDLITGFKFVKECTQTPLLVIVDPISDSYLVEDLIKIQNDEPERIFSVLILSSVNPDASGHMLRGHRNFSVIRRGDFFKEFTRFFNNNVFDSSSYANKEQYCKISFDCLSILHGLGQDLYIRLGSGRYVKLYKEGDEVSDLDLGRYVKKGIEYFYLRRETMQWVLDQIQKQAQLFFSKNSYKFILKSPFRDLDKDSFDSKIIKIQGRFYLDDHFRLEIKKKIDLIMKVLESNKKTKDMLALIKKSSDKLNFYSRKLTLLSFIASSLAREMKWDSRNTFEKLVFASATHDLTLAAKPHLMRIASVEEADLHRGTISDEDYADYINHPVDANNLLKEAFESIPFEAGSLVLEHHELPDGSGFPQHLNGGKIAPLSALFIISQDLAHTILVEDSLDLADYILNAEKKFTGHNFKSILQKLRVF